jgi:hypothetical protein
MTWEDYSYIHLQIDSLVDLRSISGRIGFVKLSVSLWCEAPRVSNDHRLAFLDGPLRIALDRFAKPNWGPEGLPRLRTLGVFHVLFLCSFLAAGG